MGGRVRFTLVKHAANHGIMMMMVAVAIQSGQHCFCGVTCGMLYFLFASHFFLSKIDTV